MEELRKTTELRIDKQAINLATELQKAKTVDKKIDIANRLSLLILASISKDQSRAQQILNKLPGKK